MGIYFRDILLTRISRGANNCGQHPLEKNSYFIMRFSPHFQLFYFNDRLEFCEFFEGKIKRINNADLFSQLPLLIFIKGANISGGHCISDKIKIQEFHSPKHTCCDDVTIKVIWFDNKKALNCHYKKYHKSIDCFWMQEHCSVCSWKA